MSFTALQETSEPAALLLCILAYLDGTRLTKEFFWHTAQPKTQIRAARFKKQGLVKWHMHPWLQSIIVHEDTSKLDDVAFECAVSLLVSLAMIRREDDKPYRFLKCSKH